VIKLKKDLLYRNSDIKLLAKKLNIELIGVAKADPFYEFCEILENRIKNGQLTHFEHKDINMRITPQNILKTAKSSIVIGIPYYQNIEQSFCSDTFPLSSVAWGMDYHKYLRKIMAEMITQLKKFIPEIETKALVDNHNILDKGMAYRAGLGFYGKNQLLINPDYGSYFFIGQILTNLEFDFYDKPIETEGCKECTKCIDACPVAALEEGMNFYPERCISYLTQKKKLTPDEENKIKYYLYGCDICQKACPYNKNLKTTEHSSFITDIETVNPKKEEILELNEEIYNKYFADTSACWINKEIIRRNGKLLLKNSNKKSRRK
jgi:epoxyqueuosine reductase